MRKLHAKAVPSKDYFTHMRTLIVVRRYDVPRDWLWDACHMAGVRWGSRCEGFCSKEGLHYPLEWSTRNPTINLIHELGNPLGFLTQAVLRSLAGLMSRKKVSVQGFLWVRKIWFAFVQQTFALETFGKRRKGENFTGSKSTTRFPQASCFKKPMRSVPETCGCMFNVPARSAKVQETGREIWFRFSQERSRRN
jgi:hypothetical protein